MVRVDEKQLFAFARVISDLKKELTLKKVVLEYAIADIPHTCQFCMSKKCPNVAYDCEGCENGSRWCWYGVMEV